MVLFVLFHLLVRLNVLPPQSNLTGLTANVAHPMLACSHFPNLDVLFLDVDNRFEQIGRALGALERLGYQIFVCREMLSTAFAAVHLAFKELEVP